MPLTVVPVVIAVFLINLSAPGGSVPRDNLYRLQQVDVAGHSGQKEVRHLVFL